MERSAFLSGAIAYVAAAASPTASAPLAKLEARYGGRLGVAALDSASGARLEHRADERFPMCSTFKVLLVGTVLSRVDAGLERIDRRIAYRESDLLDYAPIARANLARGFLTVRASCEAAIEESDNTAANLLLRSVGGPARVTAYARSLGDARTRLDRSEPELNSAIPATSAIRRHRLRWRGPSRRS